MRILWLINVPLPEASILMNEQPSPYGGWLINAAKDLSMKNDIDLAVVFTGSNINNTVKLKGQNIIYYVCEQVKDHNTKVINENYQFSNILKEYKPDLVHIYGTELAHTLSMVNACKKERIETVISIQGLVSVIARHMYANLPLRVIYGFTLRNLLNRDNVWGYKKLFLKRGENEVQALQKTKHIIGRTIWDRAITEQINPTAQYHFCNETLREEFYKHSWDIESCERHSIFLSQGQYSIKGLHYMLEAMPLILNKYPDTKLYIGGKDITKADTFKDRLLLTYYGKYIKYLIKKFNLQDKVVFTGPLDEKKMCERYLQSNVFVCPSSIENSPNSLGEAMLLGVPCVASSVGGISDMLEHKKDGYMYQTDAPYMLAYYVCEIFGNKEKALEFSGNAKLHARNTHDRYKNLEDIIAIYKKIISEQ